MSTDINIGEFLTTRAHMNPRKEALIDVHAGKRVTYDLERQMRGATLLKTSEFADAIIGNLA